MSYIVTLLQLWKSLVSLLELQSKLDLSLRFKPWCPIVNKRTKTPRRSAAESALIPVAPCDVVPCDVYLQASCRDAAMMAVREDLHGAREVKWVSGLTL